MGWEKGRADEFVAGLRGPGTHVAAALVGRVGQPGHQVGPGRLCGGRRWTHIQRRARCDQRVSLAAAI